MAGAVWLHTVINKITLLAHVMENPSTFPHDKIALNVFQTPAVVIFTPKTYTYIPYLTQAYIILL